MMRKRSFSLILVILLLACLAPLRAEGADVGTYGDLEAAVKNPDSLDIRLTADILITSPIEISLDVKIDGDGKKLTANGGRHFRITGGSGEFSNVTLEGGTGNNGGIDISSGATPKFTNVTFDKNRAANGGAVNVASGATATFSGTNTFTSNTATGNGGAVNVASGATATFNGATFTDNTATTDGGAVYAQGTATFSGTNTFTGNSAANGGAVSVPSGATVTFSGTNTFTKNVATTEDGGAIYWVGDLALDNGFTFRENAARRNGGAVYSEGTATISGGTFTTNAATVDGGAVYATGAVRVTGGTFGGSASYANTAEDGGAIYGNTTVNVSGGEFSYNSARIDGGAIYAGGGATISGGTFANNESSGATNGGGAVYSGSATTISGGTFTTNAAKANGGAVYAAGTADITGGSFANNTATVDGGAVYATGAVTVDGVDFPTVNTAGRSGGAIYSRSSVSTTNATFSKQTATSHGGAIYAVGAVTITGGNFSDNTSTGTSADGGAIYAASVKATDATFEANTATHDGGAIYTSGTGGSADLKNDVFLGNTSGRQGGAVSAANLKVESSTFRGNISTTAGGAIYLQSGSSDRSTIVSSFFVNNQANALGGGAVYLTGDKNPLTIQTSVFHDNYAVGSGGALSLDGADVVIYRSTFTDNKLESVSTAKGGAVYLNSDRARIGNSTFHNNKAGPGTGGAVYLDTRVGGIGERSALVHNTFVNNGADKGGGLASASEAVYLASNLLVANSASYGKDIFGVSGKMTSQGYNLLSGYGEMQGSSASNGVNWRAATCVDAPLPTAPEADRYEHGDEWSPEVIFGTSSPEPADNGWAEKAGSSLAPSDPSMPNQKTPGTIALEAGTGLLINPAIGVIPNSRGKSLLDTYFTGVALKYEDERGAGRTKRDNDIGAYEHAGELPPVGPTSGDVSGELSYIRISGIPNTLTTVGQTATLIAVAYDGAGKLMATSVPVKWSSSNEGVARFGKGEGNGNLVAVGLGQTTIRATSTVATRKGEYPSDTVQLYVTNETMEWLNVAPSVWEELYRQDFEQDGIVFSFADADPKRTSASSFRSSFRVAWNATPDQLTNVGSSSTPIEFERAARSFSPQGGWTSAKAGVGLQMRSRSRGDLLPIVCTWNFTWDALSKMLGRSVTDVPSDLFDALRLDFEATDGQVVPMVGLGGVSATDAQKALSPQLPKPLSVDKTNNGVNVTLTAFIANVSGTEARLIDGLLVVPDGTSDSVLGGTLWTAQKPKSGGGSGGDGEGGGGCDAASLGALAILSGAAIVMRKKK